LEEFDAKNKVDLKEIFKNKHFISLDEEIQKKIDN
jgi:hypothetical protein